MTAPLILQRIPFFRTQTDTIMSSAEKKDPLITTRLLTPIEDDIESHPSSTDTSPSHPGSPSDELTTINTLTRRLKLARGVICVLSFTTLAFLLLFLLSLAHNQSGLPLPTAATTTNTAFSSYTPGHQHPSSPGLSPADTFPSLATSGALSYTRHPFPVHLHNNPFSGPPRPELDAAWHELFEDIRIRVSAEDLAFYNVSSIPLAQTQDDQAREGGGGGGGRWFAAELGVHHELHCLKKIRHWIHRDYYGLYLKEDGREGGMEEGEMREMQAHVDHCVEMIREAIVCRGDTSLSSFEWVGNNPIAAGNGSGGNGGGKGDGKGEEGGGRGGARLTAVAKGWHTCVNWDSLMGWVRERHVKVFEEGFWRVRWGCESGQGG
ncbi:uncharacterized protein KY384_004615 [Bacidia gigantensis]|uniref:uncharacterized protein n=1 Tax=Bacidia gigantensis TaxID=2732470 RepID=UPI001D03BE09|nr:uncharacterized protein KY384_004615 [Bacidia gigantensis]KAG8531257.1 hypothetical protein KY384_004615 [Bacidia gigantensis]